MNTMNIELSRVGKLIIANGVHIIRIMIKPEPCTNRVNMLPIRKTLLFGKNTSIPRATDEIMPRIKPKIISLLRPHRALHLPRIQPRIILGAAKAAKNTPLKARESWRL